MKKIACTLFVLVMLLFLINPIPSEARGGHHGGYGGWWWAPWAIVGGAVAASAYYSSNYYYAPYYQYPPPRVVVQTGPPVYVASGSSIPQGPPERVFIYPRRGQNQDQQAKDQYECHSWARNQTHFDPTQVTGDMPVGQLNQMRSDYNRAMGACLDGRGYTMK